MSARLVIESRTVIYLESAPSPDKILGITFKKGSNVAGELTGTVLLGPTKPEDHVTSRMVTVTINGVDSPAVEGITIPPTFVCSAGDTCSAVSVAANSAGTAGPSNVVTVVAALPQGPPSPDVVAGIAFAPTVAAAPVPNP